MHTFLSQILELFASYDYTAASGSALSPTVISVNDQNGVVFQMQLHATPASSTTHHFPGICNHLQTAAWSRSDPVIELCRCSLPTCDDTITHIRKSLMFHFKSLLKIQRHGSRIDILHGTDSNLSGSSCKGFCTQQQISGD